MLNLVKTKVVTIVVNYRNRIKEITDNFAGNYDTMIIYQKADYETPKLIRKSLGSKQNNNLFKRVIT